MKKAFLIGISIALAASFISGCFYNKQFSDPNNENIGYMYFTVWPSEASFSITVEFNDNTPTFHDERISKEHEPLVYSVDRRKVKLITVKVEKYGWETQTNKYEKEIPADTFIKLEEKL